MGEDRESQRWVLLSRKFHRVQAGTDPKTTLCGRPCPGDDWATQAVSEHLLRHRTTVCGSCDRQHRTEEPKVKRSTKSALTPAQQKAAAWLVDERKRRIRTRELADLDQPEQSQSVRAISSGLPSLGKHRP